MSVKIRLKRMGNSKRPIYRIIVIDSRFSGKGRRVDDLGTYNPRRSDQPVINFKKESVLEWIKKGAIPSESVRTLLKNSKV